jgi:hypothetical protein
VPFFVERIVTWKTVRARKLSRKKRGEEKLCCDEFLLRSFVGAVIPARNTRGSVMSFSTLNRSACMLFVVAGVSLVGDVARAQTEVIIAKTGDASPDGVGTFGGFGFGRPSLNDLGQAAFNVNLTGAGVTTANDWGNFLGSGGPLTAITREGDPAPGTSLGSLWYRR